MMTTLTPTRPILRYPGGKWLLAPWIVSHFPPHRTYVEPFCGAASCLWRKPRSYAEVLNDLDGEIVNLFRVVRDPASAATLAHLIALTPYARQEYADAYTETDDPVERARRMLIRSWQGHNSEGTLRHTTGWRNCFDRQGTLPAHDWARFPQQISRFVARLQGVNIEAIPALDILAAYDSPTTLFYVDPPYDDAACPHFNGYRHTVTATALQRALNTLQGMVLLSGYRSPTYDTLYQEWLRVERVSYAGSGQTSTRKRTETLWINAACQQTLPQLQLF